MDHKRWTFDVLLDLESSEPCLPTLVYEEKQKPDTLATINNYNFYEWQTYMRTWRLHDQPVGGEEKNLNKGCAKWTKST